MRCLNFRYLALTGLKLKCSELTLRFVLNEIMEVQPREIQTYETLEGKIPFEEWLDSLRDREGKAKIKGRLQRVGLGNLGDCKSVGEGVSELKIDCGPGYRVYFGERDSTIVLLLCGGDKSTQDRDIRKAKEYWIEFRSRNNA